jgi:ABC-type multidrug transport system ATPase subunit
VVIYQASQAIYDIFDKVTLLCEGRQIYYGEAGKAKRYFEEMGWFCPRRQTTADFLTSVTNPKERQVVSGRENQVPQTPEEFERYWLQSEAYRACIADIERHEEIYPSDGSGLRALKDSHPAVQSKYARHGSPYIVFVTRTSF